MSDETTPQPPQDPAATPDAQEDLAIARQAPGVLGANQAPEQSTLKTGDVLSGAFTVERYLGSSPGAVSYYCRDQRKDREVVVKLLELGAMPQEDVDQFGRIVRQAGGVKHRNLVRILGLGQSDEGAPFVVMEFVDGPSLSRLLARRREARSPLAIRDVFTIIAHLCDVLSSLHPTLTHGVLTPYNMHVNRSGTLKVSNLVFGSTVAALLSVRGQGPYRDSIYIAPELVRDPTALTPAADIYSLGMLAVELLSPRGLPADRNAARGAVSGVLAAHPPQLTQLVLSMLASEPDQRPQDLMQIRDIFEEVAAAKGARLGEPPGPEDLPIEPAATRLSEQPEDEDELFELAGMLSSRDELNLTSEFAIKSGGFFVQRDGLDYGPYSREEVLKQLYADDIHEGTSILDRDTQARLPLGEHEAFKQAVEAYIPKREERRAREAAARAELQRKVKKGGWTLLAVSCVIGGIVLVGMVGYLISLPKPLPLPEDKLYASLDYKLLPPPKEFETVAVDAAMLQSIFDPKAGEEEIAKKLKKLRKRRKPSGKRPASTSKSGSGGDDENVTVVSMGGSDGPEHILTDEEVQEVILSKFGSLRQCVMQELKVNRGFKGVTVKFFVRPSGTTGGVKILESAYASKPVGECLVERFRVMKFPRHTGFNRGVKFPLRVQ